LPGEEAAWGWPPADLTYDADRDDLARHEAEIEAHQLFNYALFDTDETALLGCVHIDPPEKAGADAEISWWIIDELVDSSSRRRSSVWFRTGSHVFGRSPNRGTSVTT